ncbi:MAG: ApaG domain [Verrucomicrobiales bacterium]|nr:ApaG domain [Verrucomicrobiales bacterium]
MKDVVPEEFAELEVSVDDVLYMPSLDAPVERPHPFVYFITITNGSAETVQILARKWIVSEAGGETVVVEGDGVVGQKPLLEPGEKFSYNSYHVVNRDSRVKGAFFGKTVAGRVVYVLVPEFDLHVPQWA